jgi:predicted transglutaminase-like cysteine proteinase
MQRFIEKVRGRLPSILVLSALGFAACTVGATQTAAAPPIAAALNFRDASFASSGGATQSPYGWLHFCRAQPAECAAPQLEPAYVELTSQAWGELNQINTIINRQIKPLGDEDHYRIYEQSILNWWTYPDDGKGNCNDYVLMKRKLLVEAGWPRSALLMTVVIDHSGGGHLILTVQTDQGDLILDNMREEIVSWDRTGYRFVKRQSGRNANEWVSIQPQGDARTAAAAAADPRRSSTAVQLPVLVDERVAVPVEQSEAARNDDEKSLELTRVRALSRDLPANHVAGHALAELDDDAAKIRQNVLVEPTDHRRFRHVRNVALRDRRLAGGRHQHNDCGACERGGKQAHRATPAAAMAGSPLAL